MTELSKSSDASKIHTIILQQALLSIAIITILALTPTLLIYSCQSSFEKCSSYVDISIFPSEFPQREKYMSWCLINMVISIPMVVQTFVDFSSYSHENGTYEYGIYRCLLIAYLIIINLLNYCFLYYDSFIMTTLCINIMSTQVNILQCFILLKMFCTQIYLIDTKYRAIRLHLGKITLYYIYSRVVYKILCLLSLLNTHHLQYYFLIEYLILVIKASKIVILVYCICRVFIFICSNFKDSSDADFPYKLSDMLNCSVLLLYTVNQNYELNAYILSKEINFMYIQILLIAILTLTALKSKLSHATLKENKLKGKLNLMRYVSHEMRTPLNISILGIKLSYEKIYEYVTNLLTKRNINYDYTTTVYEQSQKVYFKAILPPLSNK